MKTCEEIGKEIEANQAKLEKAKAETIEHYMDLWRMQQRLKKLVDKPICQ